jgi:hypothetical protein
MDLGKDGGFAVVASAKKSSSQRNKKKHSVTDKKSSAKHHRAAAAHPSEVATIDRRRPNGDRRKSAEESKASAPVEERKVLERRVKVNRRRQIDPTTCERDYTAEEVEFMSALDEYKRRNGRMFPTCSEVLEVIRSLGYIKAPKVEEPAPAVEPIAVPSAVLPEITPVISHLPTGMTI